MPSLRRATPKGPAVIATTPWSSSHVRLEGRRRRITELRACGGNAPKGGSTSLNGIDPAWQTGFGLTKKEEAAKDQPHLACIAFWSFLRSSALSNTLLTSSSSSSALLTPTLTIFMTSSAAKGAPPALLKTQTSREPLMAIVRVPEARRSSSWEGSRTTREESGPKKQKERQKGE